MTLDVVRERILRSKRQELLHTVLSRKRKLRELYAVARSQDPIPNRLVTLDDPPLDDNENNFLDANDILKGRFFNESTLPPRPSHVWPIDFIPPQVEELPPALAPPPPPPSSSEQTLRDEGDEMLDSEAPVIHVAEKVMLPTVDSSQDKPDQISSLPSPVPEPNVPSDVSMKSVEEPNGAQHGMVDQVADGGDPMVEDDRPDVDSTTVHQPSSPERSSEITKVDSLPSPKEKESVPERVSETLGPAESMPEGLKSTSAPPSRSLKPPNTSRSELRSKPSAVIFAKARAPEAVDTPELIRKGDGKNTLQDSEPDDSYMVPLFISQAYTPPRAQSLNSLLASAHKTLNTADLYVDFHEQQDSRILRRIYQLQYANRWSLRQIERVAEPNRQVTHWDALLDHMRWMRTDFREERKWKMTMTRNIAEWCADWVRSRPEDRAALQVRVKQPSKKLDLVTDENRPPITDIRPSTHPPLLEAPGLKIQTDMVPSMEGDPMIDAPEEEVVSWSMLAGPSPASLFSLHPNDAAFMVQRTPSSDTIMNELPLYESAKTMVGGQTGKAPGLSETEWKVPIVPASRYVQGKLIRAEPSYPRTKSRYDFEEEEEESAADQRVLAPRPNESTHSPAILRTGRIELSPELKQVALFDPENKHIRDRIHAGHAFRPPSEYQMPSQTFFECRTSSQWTVMEEYELRALVKQYSYNWSLISSLLSRPSPFSSGAERRTPWECFERWLSLEGLPADMQRTQYFRTYHARLEAAHRNTMPDSQQQSQSSQPEGTSSSEPPRRRSTQPLRVERRKQSRYLALFDAMRKLAKKRETALQKQQQVAGMAAMRKANIEATQTRSHVHRPQDFSRIKFERDLKMQERAEAYRQQMLAQQRAALQQRSAQHAVQQPAATNGVSQPQRNGNSVADGASNPLVPSFPGNPNHAAFPTQARPQTSLQVPPNNVPMYGNGGSNVAQAANINNAMRMKAIPQAHMQSSLPGQLRNPQPITPEMRMLMENNRIQQEQRRFVQQQQQHGQLHVQGQQAHNPAGNSSSPVVNMKPLGGQAPVPSNPAMLAALQAASNVNGMVKPATNNMGVTGGPSSSPHMGQVPLIHTSQPQSLSNGMIPAINSITHQIKARNPNASPEQIKKMTNDQLTAQYQHRISQTAAMNAAAGLAHTGQTLGIPNGSNGLANQQQQQLYAQMIRAQQASQSKGGIPIPNGIRPPSRSATPQTQRGPPNMNMNVQATAPGQNQSPRPPQAQVAGGQ